MSGSSDRLYSIRRDPDRLRKKKTENKKKNTQLTNFITGGLLCVGFVCTEASSFSCVPCTGDDRMRNSWHSRPVCRTKRDGTGDSSVPPLFFLAAVVTAAAAALHR